MARKTVPAAEVRSWARDNIDLIPEGARKGLGPTARGRLHPDIVKAFAKAHKGKTYETGAAEAATITVPVTTVDSLGRKTTKRVTITTKEARTLVGAEGKVGRLSHALVSEALSAQSASEVADQFSKVA